MVAAIRGVNVGLAFVVELAGLAAFAYWGANATDAGWARVVLAIAAPVLAATVWGLFAAPKATIELAGPAVTVLKFALLALAVLALVAAGRPWWAVWFGGIALANAAILAVLPA